MANTKVEVAFELTVGDTPYFRLNDPVKGKLNNTSYRLAGPIWIDITNRVANVNIKRGKNRELDRYSAGVATITLHNEDRAFDPLNDASPYVGNIIPRRAVRVSTADVTQFTGVIDDWNLDYSVGGKANAVIVASDAFSLLAQQSLTAGTATAQTTGERINAVLSMPSVGWPLTQRSIDTGLATVGADVWASDNNVLTYLQKVEASEQGQLFMNRDGYVRFVNGGVTPETFGDWELSRTNLVTNPSMESVTSGAVVMRRNLCTNPSVETDLTGWVFSGLTGTRVTTESYVGTASVQCVSSAQNDYVVSQNGVVSPSATYTVSAWVKGEAGKSLQASLFEYNSGGYGSGSTAGAITTATGSWQRLSVTRTLTANAATARIVIYNKTAGAHTFYVDAAMIEASSVVGDYFDGSTTDALGWDYAWSGTANASISTAACAATTVRTNLVTNPSFEVDTTGWGASGLTNTRVTTEFYVGTASVQAAATAIDQYSYTPPATVTASQTYTASIWLKGEAGKSFQVYLFEYNSGGYGSGSTAGAITTATGSWQRLSVTRTLTANAATARIVIYNKTAGAHTFYEDAAMIEAGSTAGDYFDGSFNPAGDFSYAWTGTANASTSIQRGATLVGTADPFNNSAGYQSNAWAEVGSKSVRITPITANGDTFVSPGGDVGALRLGMVAGNTYTVSGTIRLAAAQTGTLNARARRIAFFYKNSAGTYVEAQSTQAPNAAGSTRLSLTFTVPAGATEAFIRLYNGASAGNGDVWWDAVLMEASPIVQDYFDGSTTPTTTVERYAWTGTANASTSTKEIRQPIIYPTFSDQNDGIPYTATAISYGTELLYNQVAVKYSGGTETASNAISQAKYGITGTEVDTLLSTNTAAQSLATFWVTKYGEPEYRFQDIEVSLDGTPVDKVEQVLNIELGDIVFIKFTPNNVGSAIERYGQIIKKEHSIGVDRHNIVFGLAALPFSFLELDSTSIGILDENVLAF